MQIRIKTLQPAAFFLLISTLLVAFGLLTPSVSAVGKPAGVGGKQQAQTRLTEAKLRTCQAKEKSIQNRFTRLNNLVTNMESKFDSIAGRVEEYYTTKVTPGGKTVANYGSLVADMAAKKAAVQTVLTNAQNDVAGFSCDGNDPKGQLTQFRKDMQAVKSALKEYRTSIKNLIVAVHSVTGSTESENAGSPKPTKTD